MYKDPREKNEHTAWIHISGFDVPPDEITEKLGVEPTEVRVKGEERIVGKVSPKIIVNRENLWTLKSGLPKSAPLEKHVESLLKVIVPSKKNFIEISKECEVQFNCAVYYYEANPGISLEKNILKEIAEFNLPLYLDIYCLAGTVKELDDNEVKDDLVRQLSQVKSVSELSDEGKDEPRDLVENLRRIEFSIHKIENSYLPEMFVNGEMPEEYYQDRLQDLTNELKNLLKHVKNSKYLRSEVLD
jgi:hypothetical protein